MISLRSFEVPTVVKHAPGALSALAGLTQDLGMRRPMLVTDQGLVKAGLVDEVIQVLKAGNVDYVLFDQVEPEPTDRARGLRWRNIPAREMRRSDWLRRR